MQSKTEAVLIVMRKNHRFFDELGERIGKRRKALGLTQTELGDLMRVRQQVIASYESASRQIPAWRLPELAKALDMTLEELLGVNGAPHRSKRGPKSKIERQLDAVREMPRKEQQFVSQLLDKMLAQANVTN
jgi:transcriptional regulator with XRE-family HTH domain